MKVSVVIPTTFRESLDCAVASVEEQTLGRNNIELIVVADVDANTAMPSGLLERCDHVLITGGGKGGGGARQLGVELASHELVAFLDDDEVWLPSKLEIQLGEVRGEERVVVGCRVIQFGEDLAAREVPRRLIEDEESIQDYLFRARRASIDRNSFFTSTILTTREVLSNAQWNPDLRRHQDWDWLLRAAVLDNVRFVQVPAPLVRYWTGSPNSISATSGWRESLEWYETASRSWDRRTSADFLSAQVLRYALQARSAEGVRDVMRSIVATRAIPSPSCWLVGWSGLLGRRRMQRVMHSTGKRSRG